MKSSTPITDKSDNCYQSIVQDWSIIIPQDNYLDYDDQNMYTCFQTALLAIVYVLWKWNIRWVNNFSDQIAQNNEEKK